MQSGFFPVSQPLASLNVKLPVVFYCSSNMCLLFGNVISNSDKNKGISKGKNHGDIIQMANLIFYLFYVLLGQCH